MYSVCILTCVSMGRYSYLSTQGISGLAARGDCQQFEVCLKMTTNMYSLSLIPRPLPLDQHTPAVTHWRWTWRPWSSEFGDAIGDRDWVYSEMHWEAVIESVWRCTVTQWWSQRGDTLWSLDWVSLEMHFEALIEWVGRCTLRPWLREFGDALRGHDQASLEMQLDTEIEWMERCTGRPWSSEFEHWLGRRNQVSSEMHSKLWSGEFRDALAAVYARGRIPEYLEVVDLEAVDGSHARCWDCVHRLVNSKPWECDKVTLPLGLLCRTRWWQSICREVRQKLKLHSGVNLQSREWRHDRESYVYAVRNVSCTRRMLHLAYAALGVTSWWWHGETEWDDLTLCSCNDGRVVDEKERDRGWRWERYGGYEQTWEIMGMTCMIGFRRPHIGVTTRLIGTGTCRIRDGKLTRTRNCLESQFLMMISPISSDLSLSCAQLYHHLRTWS